jgi:aminopeptidase N
VGCGVRSGPGKIGRRDDGGFASREDEDEESAVPEENLTRDEARARAALLDVDSYQVALDLTTSERTFSSTSTITFACARPGADTFLDLIATRLVSVTLNGAELDPGSYDGSRVALPNLAAHNEVTVVAECAYSRTGEGLHRFVDPADGAVYLYSQFEPADARRMFANFEQPDLKASFQFTVTAPAAWQVLGNSATPEPEVHGEVGVWRFAPTPRISTYITVIVAGPYHVERDHYERVLENGETLHIPLAVACRASLAGYLRPAEIFTVTKQGLDFFHDAFGFPYPFGVYSQAFVPEYNLGAMENPGCVTFTEEVVFRAKVTDAAYEGRATVILHEMAHMWFGDLVTMAWWDDLWLKESFADYMGELSLVEATEWTGGWTSFANRRKAWAYRQDQLPTTHPIVADIRDLQAAKLNFDGITYAKGASVLKQLVAYVGQQPFLAGARAYFVKHAWGNTRLADLLDALEQASGRDLGNWSRAWLETSGVNTLRPELEVDAAGLVSKLTIHQEASAEHPTLRPHRIAIGCFEQSDHGLSRVRRVELDITGERTEVPELVGVPRPRLLLLNDEDLSFCKIRFDDVSLATIRSSLADIDDQLARALCWSAAWDMTRDGEMPARDFIDLVRRFAGQESKISVL